MLTPVTTGLVRHALTLLGGYFVSKGDISQGDAEALAGAVAACVGVLWSVLAKRKF
jgi:hypothetical protein